MAYSYWTATETGRGFITHQESADLKPKGYGLNIWRIRDMGVLSTAWVTKVNASSISKEEAQTLLDNALTTSQSEWDASPARQEQVHRPVRRILE
jgi:hypothetical protein